MKIFIVAGEASGDMHAANLVKQIKQRHANVELEGWGGDKMEAAGVRIHKHISSLAFMGFVEVLRNLKTILRNFKLIKSQILTFQPDAIVLVDYPGFNLRLAQWLKTLNFNVIYYIAPQVWAWKENRVQKLKRYTDKILCILPFEKEFFARHNVAVDYVGHPLLEQIRFEVGERKEIIALLPGSRLQEVSAMLPIMLSVMDAFDNYYFKIAKSSNLSKKVYEKIIGNKPVEIYEKGSASLLSQAKFALVTSGTATLETALYAVPQIVCYKSGSISYQIAKRLIKVPYISLVNLIANKEVVKELIQQDFNSENLKIELKKLGQPAIRQQMLDDYQAITKLLGDGTASAKAAQIIIDYLNSKR